MRLINVRKLASLELYFHGPRFILIEFTAGVVLCAGLGIWFLVSGINSGPQRPMASLSYGIVLIGISVNYLTLLIYAVSIMRRKSAKIEVTQELANPDRYMSIYSIQSAIFIILPLVLSLLAAVQEVQNRMRK